MNTADAVYIAVIVVGLVGYGIAFYRERREEG